MGDSLNKWVSNGLEWNRERRIDCTLLYVMPLKFEKPYRAMSVNNSLQIVADDNNNNSSGQGRGSKGEMIAAVGNINIMEASQRTGTWLLLHAHGIITKPQRQQQQQLQIKANIKSGNFPWQRWKVTGNLKAATHSKQANLPEEPTLNPSEPQANQATQHWLCFLRAICGFERISGLRCCLPTRLRPPPCPSLLIVLLGKCRAHGECHVFCQANDRLNIYYLESFALLCSNLNPRVVCLQLYCAHHKGTTAKGGIHKAK